MRLPVTGGTTSELLATDAWGTAAVGDSNRLCCQQRKSLIKSLSARQAV
jgi:hypothetical protein